jgi:hypothetical protein
MSGKSFLFFCLPVSTLCFGHAEQQVALKSREMQRNLRHNSFTQAPRGRSWGVDAVTCCPAAAERNLKQAHKRVGIASARTSAPASFEG